MNLLRLSILLLLLSVFFANGLEPVTTTAAIMGILTSIETILGVSSAIVTLVLPIIDEIRSEKPIDYQPHLNAISAKLDQLQSHTFDYSVELLKEVNMATMKQYYSRVDAQVNDFYNILRNAQSHTIVRNLQAFLSRYQSMDAEMMNYLSSSIGGSSLSKRYFDLMMNYANNPVHNVQASPSSLLYQFQISTLYMALKYATVFECATLIKNKLNGEALETSIWADRKQQLMNKFVESVTKSSEYLRDKKSLSSYLNLKSNAVKTLQFRKVFQTYWKYEDEISLTQSWSENCDFGNHFKRPLNDEYCNGQIGNCFYNDQFGKERTYGGPQITAAVNTYSYTDLEKYFISNNPERIYDQYTLSGSPFGHYTTNYKKQFELKTEKGFTRHRDICQCTCDQYNAPNTVRKIYGGRISAPQGNVITGVRFQMTQNVLYLDIQFGKLVGMGMVDPSTLVWHGPPYDLSHATFTVDFDHRQFGLDDVYFTDGNVLTGIQLLPINNIIRARITGSRIVKHQYSMDSLENLSSYHTLTSTSNDFKVQNKNQGIQQNNNNFSVKRSDTDTVIVEFGTSSEKTDAGQTTVPFFDGSDIVQEFPLALSGIGFIHYTNADHAGYLRPILKSADMKFVI